MRVICITLIDHCVHCTRARQDARAREEATASIERTIGLEVPVHSATYIEYDSKADMAQPSVAVVDAEACSTDATTPLARVTVEPRVLASDKLLLEAHAAAGELRDSEETRPPTRPSHG